MSVTERLFAVVLVAVVVVALVVWMLRSYRRGGLGPPMKVTPSTRGGRRRVNDSYTEHGWAMPFDEDGNLLPAKDRRRPDGARDG